MVRNMLSNDDAILLYCTHIFHFNADIMLMLC